MSETKLYMCPNCSSPAISWDIDDAKVILQGPQVIDFVCDACGWKGKQEDLIASPFSHEWGNDQGLLDALVRDLRRQLAKDVGQSLLHYLLRWGFMEAADPTTLARYLSAMSGGMIKALMEERLKLEKEAAGARE
jgi:hypothetical protein